MSSESSPSSSPIAQELLREREFFKYFEPLDYIPPTLEEVSLLPDGAIASNDVALKAFTQLAALRINAASSVISLISSDTQYIVAESTRSMALGNDKQHDPGDGLWYGCMSFPSSIGLCHGTVSLPPRLESMTDDNINGVATSVVINDLSQHPKFKDHPAVAGPPFIRFYAGVPIRTLNGLHIGSFCVIDGKARDDFSEESVQFMKDLSVNIFTHLDNIRVKQEHRRSEKMVRGMAAFIEGKSSLHGWWANNHNDESLRRVDSSVSQVAPDVVVEPERSPSMKKVVSFSTKGPSSTSLSHNNNSAGRQNSNSHPPETAPSIQSAFTRASNILREALEVEGAVFLDASNGAFEGFQPDVNGATEGATSCTSTSEDETRKKSADLSNASTTNDVLNCGVLGYSEAGAPGPHAGQGPPDRMSDLPENVLRYLLRTYPRGKAFMFADEDVVSSESESEPLTMSRRARRAENDKKSQETATKSTKAARRQLKTEIKTSRLKTLKDTFGGARCLIFYPLWDARRERWFAGAFIWTKKQSRILTEDTELNYLAAFSNSVMQEISRLGVLRADRIKTDFISSISHELRSPLHGILGSVEVLHETNMDSMQNEMVRIVETCGKTLLDTFNHLLDFAKINSFTRRRSDNESISRRLSFPLKRGKSMIIDGMMNLDADIDLALITEEVVQTMCATPRSATNQGRGYRGTNSNESMTMLDPGTPKVNVIVDIDCTSWTLRAPPGAWRRILMNLIGNSVKYTETGFIHVRMQGKEVHSKRGDADKMVISLVVTDSGKGMSKEYLRDHLYTAFAQEDPLTPGTGLGLSIVKQIVTSLGGTIEVQSQQKKGTEFKMTFSFAKSELNSEIVQSKQEKDSIAAVAAKTRGLTFKLMGLEDSGNASIHGPDGNSASSIGTSLWRTSIERLCGEWFGMRLLSSTQTEIVPDLIVAAEGANTATRLEHISSAEDQIPTILICSDIGLAYSHMYGNENTHRRNIVGCVSQPAGPQKLAKALTIFLEHIGRMSSDAIDAPQSDLSTSQATEIAEANTKPAKIVHEVITSPDKMNLLRAADEPATSKTGTSLPVNYSIETITKPTSNTPKKPAPSPKSRPAEGPPLALLVDDNDVNLRLLAMAMQKVHVPYATATNGQEAVDQFKQYHSTIKHVFMDISMPIMDGLTATREIRQFERQNGVNPSIIVALTGLASAGAQQDAQASGVTLFLTKPVPFRNLKSIVIGDGTI